MTLKEEVIHLVTLEQEGGYWDFKKQWHDNKTSLLHDVICMANNLHNRNAYIIIGIDEEDNFAVVDVKADPNRRNTQNMARQNIIDLTKREKLHPIKSSEKNTLYLRSEVLKRKSQ